MHLKVTKNITNLHKNFCEFPPWNFIQLHTFILEVMLPSFRIFALKMWPGWILCFMVTITELPKWLIVMLYLSYRYVFDRVYVIVKFEIFRSGVDFTNIIRTNFLYECLLCSFFYIHTYIHMYVRGKKLLNRRRTYEKFVRKMLMKLTPGVDFTKLFLPSKNL